MTLTLYTNPMSRGRIAHWLMEEAGLPYDLVYLDFGTTMQGPEYLALNPMGKVPTLVHDGRVITEYHAICAYVADSFPQAGLKPAETSAYYRWLFFGAGPMEGAIITASLGAEITPEQRRRVGFRELETMADILADWLGSHPWLAGDTFSAADVATGSQIHWGVQNGSFPSRPALAGYVERITARPAHIRAAAADDAMFAAARENDNG